MKQNSLIINSLDRSGLGFKIQVQHFWGNGEVRSPILLVIPEREIKGHRGPIRYDEFSALRVANWAAPKKDRR